MTKIELQEPYKSMWKYGYIVENKENRKTLILYNSKTDRSSTQYARYLIAVELGRLLESGETVDHIDGDKTNNDLNNLQILSSLDNIKKGNPTTYIELVCPACGISFSRTLTQLRGRKHKIKTQTIHCSRSCGGKPK